MGHGRVLLHVQCCEGMYRTMGLTRCYEHIREGEWGQLVAIIVFLGVREGNRYTLQKILRFLAQGGVRVYGVYGVDAIRILAPV